MYFEIQYTIADLRYLAEVKKYDKKVIPPLESLHEINFTNKNKLKFLRSIGKSSCRRDTSYLPLEGESFRCQAKKTFRIPTFIKHEIDLGNSKITIMRDSRRGSDEVYRGYFRNTYGVVNRFQWGFNIVGVKSTESKDNRVSFNKLVKGILQIPIEIPQKKDIQKSSNFQESLSQIIETAILKRNSGDTYEQYIEETAPVIVFQLSTADFNYIDIPGEANLLKEYPEIDTKLLKYKFKNNGSVYTIYLIVTGKEPDKSALKKIRLLRICLLRFFAEKECLIKALENEEYFRNNRIKEYLSAPIQNKDQIEMLTHLELNNKNFNYIVEPEDRDFIDSVGHKILKRGVNNSALELLT